MWYIINFLFSLPNLPVQSHFFLSFLSAPTAQTSDRTFSFFLSFLSALIAQPSDHLPLSHPISATVLLQTQIRVLPTHICSTMKQQRMKTTSGCGWVAVEGEVHRQWRSAVQWLRWVGVQRWFMAVGCRVSGNGSSVVRGGLCGAFKGTTSAPRWWLMSRGTIVVGQSNLFFSSIYLSCVSWFSQWFLGALVPRLYILFIRIWFGD